MSTPIDFADLSGLKRGGPGRERGVPNKVTVEAQVAAEALVDDPMYRAKLRRDLQVREWGKPKDVIELEGRLDVNALNQMSDDELKAELAAIVAKAGGTVLWAKPQTRS